MTAIRRPGAVSAAVLVGLVVSLVTAQMVAPEWSRRTGLDVWNLPALDEQLRRATEERDEVLAFEEQSIKRREAAHQITKKLIDGLPLAVGADELMEVYQNDQGIMITLETLHPHVPTVRHRFAHFAIDRVKVKLNDDPKQSQVVIARLEAEYKQLDTSPEPEPR